MLFQCNNFTALLTAEIFLLLIWHVPDPHPAQPELSGSVVPAVAMHRPWHRWQGHATTAKCSTPQEKTIWTKWSKRMIYDDYRLYRLLLSFDIYYDILLLYITVFTLWLLHSCLLLFWLGLDCTYVTWYSIVYTCITSYHIAYIYIVFMCMYIYIIVYSILYTTQKDFRLEFCKRFTLWNRPTEALALPICPDPPFRSCECDKEFSKY